MPCPPSNSRFVPPTDLKDSKNVSPSNPLLTSGQPRNHLAERKPETGRWRMFKPNADGCGALLHRVHDEKRGITMNYETSTGEFVQCF